MTAVIIWGSSFSVSKCGVSSNSVLGFITLRVFIASIVLTVILLCTSKRKIKVESMDMKKIAKLSLVGVSGHFFIQCTALKYTSAVNASLLIALSPLLIVIHHVMQESKTMKLSQVNGVIFSFVGASLVITKGNFGEVLEGVNITGDSLMVVNTLMLAYFTVEVKQVISKYGPLIVNTYLNLFGLLALLILFFAQSGLEGISIVHKIVTNDVQVLYAALYLAIFSNVISYYGWYKGIEILGSSKTAVFNYFNPLVAILISYLYVNEKISVVTIVGGVLIIVGVYYSNKQCSDNVEFGVGSLVRGENRK